ncbi:alpha-glucan family phosphorylase [Neobacillus sp. PS3-40]|uniref:alpha-glucan family phosphorylase n=1 Tax=Neobacillus sp. PS3-40 TaxID=3070679 RepID=UPI0027E2147D|nr:alpha-glucan family phosphorylase [Neobacillus sp. PS3-40]WML46356.1 alpha-glucan family phosphorylase [Neobacillus sp. PS3-40]
MEKERLPRVAYFCMEYGLDSSLKTYAGGLGILAGDFVKGAMDSGYPIVGIGIKWKQGYTDQKIDEDGRPYDSYMNNEYAFLEDTGVTVTVNIRSRDVVCKVWKVDTFENVPVYLLDTDLPENEDAWITGQLYGWFGEERVAQEMVLGIGGIRALRELGSNVDVYHFNEGHALLAGFELIKEKMNQGKTFINALSLTKEEIVFTTHTPVVQGNEFHPIDRLVYMGANNGLTIDQLVAIGGAPFNMTVGALNMSRKANAVSKLHAKTANQMWAHVQDCNEIIGITNAIHKPTWVDESMIALAEKNEDEKLWQQHVKNKRKLISFIQKRTGVKLNKEKLIIGFSRRAVPYKRSDFIFQNSTVVDHLLKTNQIQLVFSGKAHPLDDTGKRIIEKLISYAKKYPTSVVFLENYDMEIGKMLTTGADIWLNNPRRPKEASGTSGMKAAMNGVLNVSILDGWWAEACIHRVNGWQIGDGFESDDELIQDEHDLQSLYKILLNEVLPTYYKDRRKWINLMKNSIHSCKDQFDVKRMLAEYYQKLYM